MQTPNSLRKALGLAIALALGGPAGIAVAQTTEPVTIERTQSGGLIVGQVRDAQRGAGLAGARVTVGTTVVSTDREGRFRIDRLAPGRYPVRIDFLGFVSAEQDVEVGADAGARLSVALRSTARATLDRVEVRANRESQALALNQQRASENYMNVVSADLLGRFPDINVAESTQRIPGVSIERDQGEGRYVNVRGAPLEYTNVSVDGVQLSAPNPERRTVELDTVTSDAISTLEVTKALTPDMDGDAIAGQINIVTQSALERDAPFFRASVGTGEYELRNGDNDRVRATWGGQFGADKNVGVLLSGSWSRTGRRTDNVESEFIRLDNDAIVPGVTEIKDYDGERTRTGFTARFDARLAPEHLLYAVATASKYRDEEFRNTFTIEYERHSADANDVTGTAGRATFDKELRERIQEQRIRTMNLGGEHYFGDWGVDWQASHSIGEFDIPARQQFIFRSTRRPVMRYDFSNPDFPVFTQLNADGSVLQEGINLPESVYAFRRYNQRFEDSDESETGLRLDLSRAHDWIGDSGELSFGVRARLREKESNDDRNRNSVAAGTPPYSSLLCDRESNNFGRFPFGRVFCNDIFERFGSTVRNENLRPLVEDSIVADYSADEDIMAGYFRLDARWDALSMVAGVRYEQTEIEGRAFRFDLDSGEAIAQDVSRDYDDFLPSVNFRYELDEHSILRWSYTTALSRPNYPDTVPRLVISDDDREAEAGNPDLNATFSNNFDVSYEYFLRPLGLLSVAAFHKRLDDPIFVATSIVGVGDDELQITRPENGRSGEITGIELAWQQTFESLPAPWDGLGVYANYTYADSEADLPFGIGTTQLPGTSEHNANFAVFYEKYGVNLRLAYNMRSEFIQTIALGDSDFDVYWDDRDLLDFTASYQFSDRWLAFAEVSNITDTKQRRYQGVPRRVLELEQFGRSWLVGVRYEL